ncbi:MAG TPA: hypothetical protein VFH48_39740 [Chloroflexota bacterium]|nr:hypothetical protein [Chloroflexota bacterium]
MPPQTQPVFSWRADLVHPPLPAVQDDAGHVAEDGAAPDQRLQLGAGRVAARRAVRRRVDPDDADAGALAVDRGLQGAAVDDADQARRLERPGPGRWRAAWLCRLLIERADGAEAAEHKDDAA